MSIKFEMERREAKILSPLSNFEPVSQPLEHRIDPLTGRRVIVSPERLEYVKRFIESDSDLLEELARSTLSNCPFCPGAIETRSPKFPREIDGNGRIRVGEAVCFPSLFAHEDFNGIVIPTTQHMVGLNQFSSEMLLDAFKACCQYFERIQKLSPQVRYTSIVMNFMPPAGSTIVHPHIQALASDVPIRGVAEIVEASRRYVAMNGVGYWQDLVKVERQLGERYVANLHGVDWLTPYAPIGLFEANAIVLDKSKFSSLSDLNWKGLTDGLVNVLKFYYEQGVRSFNAAFYFNPCDDGIIPTLVRIVSRYGYKRNFVSDVWSLQYMLGEQEVFESPEETCKKLSPYFKQE